MHETPSRISLSMCVFVVPNAIKDAESLSTTNIFICLETFLFFGYFFPHIFALGKSAWVNTMCLEQWSWNVNIVNIQHVYMKGQAERMNVLKLNARKWTLFISFFVWDKNSAFLCFLFIERQTFHAFLSHSQSFVRNIHGTTARKERHNIFLSSVCFSFMLAENLSTHKYA